ncbi:CENPW protein, partial [Menura novaehollandiae]|nr:CENPW protein [Menura novaehollandiae]
SRRRMKRTAPRSTLRKIIKKYKPQLRLAANADLLVRKERGGGEARLPLPRGVHLTFLLFLHRLAEESRTNAFENKSKIIKPEHTISAAKVL